jgi:predicted SnoaL-like aldol condensation-catalyzing enzyme/heme-degrading monooxygenase HmoA
MILRSWRARVAAAREQLYPRHFFDAVLPRLRALPGFRGASLLRRSVGGDVEFVVHTQWDSMQAVERFSGSRTDAAVVEPAAHATLDSFDTTVEHHEIVEGGSATTPVRDSSAERRRAATDFLRYAREGDRAAAERLIAPGARHHNPYFAAGMPALLDAITGAASSAPDRKADVKRVLVDGDFVVVHSHVRHQPEEAGVAVVHIFRFEGERIAELWDVGEPIPADNPNSDGMF